MDSSILFLAIIGLVLCYLVPGWLRNHHHASHTRMDDRFSRAMRMITPREVKQARPSRGAILRDAPLEDASSTTPELPELTVLQARSCPPSRRSRQVGLVLLVTLIALPALAALSAMQVVSWWTVTATLLLAVTCLTSLRMRVRRHRRRTLAPAVEPVTTQPRPSRSVSEEQTGLRSGRHQSAGRPIDRAASSGWQSATVLYDEDAIRTVERAAALAAARAETAEKARIRAELEANLKPGEWLPTEVPKPAYLLKPTAPARRPGPEAVEMRDGTPDANGPDHTIDLREDADEHTWLDEHAPLRRAVGD